MYALSAIVDNLDNNDLLVGLLVKNGESHAQRSIPEKAYWVKLFNFYKIVRKTIDMRKSGSHKNV